MTLTTLMHMTAVALFAASISSGAKAQATLSDPHHPNTTLAQAAPGQGPSVAPAQPGMMGPGMMGQGAMQPTQPGTQAAQPGMMGGMMGQGMMCPMMRSGMMGGMPMMGPRGHIMKVMFAIADTNGDGALSFEEVSAIHKRIFDRVDANKDGKVSPEELQAFMRE